MNQILSVSQINGYLKDLLEEDVQLKSIYVRGEISNFVHHVKSGHFYFTLKDKRSALRAVMFKWNASRLRFMPKNGMNIILFGSVNFYERDGVCQLLCVDMQPDGLGALYMAYEQLKEKLAREGLFDPAHKKPLPPFPQRIGVVTAKTGAALQDIIHILSRRYPLAELVLYPALVQGDLAPDSLVKAIDAAGRDKPDVLIVGRGGGSLEDLWAFNDERVARAVYDCPVPVISAVGHEVDYTICDLVADLRAPTPSAAAELCAPDISGLKRGTFRPAGRPSAGPLRPDPDGSGIPAGPLPPPCGLFAGKLCPARSRAALRPRQPDPGGNGPEAGPVGGKPGAGENPSCGCFSGAPADRAGRLGPDAILPLKPRGSGCGFPAGSTAETGGSLSGRPQPAGGADPGLYTDRKKRAGSLPVRSAAGG